jgi:hypothetical protein
MAESVITPEQRFAHVVAKLCSRPGVSVTVPRKRGLGSTALCINDKIFAILSSKEEFVVKLPKARVDELVAAARGTRFELNHGQPMQGWFVAGGGLEEEWLSLAEEALSVIGAG